MIRVVEPGPFATVQDLGRPGMAHFGLAESGAADRRSFRLANRLVGNSEDAAAIEMTWGGFAARFEQRAVIAATGADCSLFVGARQEGMNSVIPVAAGQVVRLGAPRTGVRSYLAVRGGLDVPASLGSRAFDTLAGVGTPPLSAGTVLPIGREALAYPCVDIAPTGAIPGDVTVRIIPGPRDDWFVSDAVATLCAEPYVVDSAADRVGMHLRGSELRRSITTELPSEGTVAGALQVPPTGRPILFLRDHPSTGGYPVLAVVVEDDIDRAAQARPGDRINFRPD